MNSIDLMENNSSSILIIDDNQLLLEALEKLFVHNKFNVDVCSDGNNAKRLIEERAVDIILCDIMMPDISGYDLFSYVRKAPRFNHIPFVFLTALDQVEDVRKGYLTGADAYVTKPFDPEFLLDLVRGKISRAHQLEKSVDEEVESYRRRVVSMLSHEFRTPLTAISAGVDLLLSQNGSLDSKNAKALLEGIARGGIQLGRLVGIEPDRFGTAGQVGQDQIGLLPRLHVGDGCRIKRWRLRGGAVEAARAGLEQPAGVVVYVVAVGAGVPEARTVGGDVGQVEEIEADGVAVFVEEGLGAELARFDFYWKSAIAFSNKIP